jgi:hypothetical protein
MATLYSIQSGNFLDATTWDVVNPSSYLDSQVNAQSLTTITTNSTTVINPGPITTSGILLQVFSRVAAPTGTVTARLFNDTTSSVIKDVTIDAVDLPNTLGTGNGYIGWTYFKFDSDVTLVVSNLYSIRVFSSVNSQVSVYRNATVNNWSRGLVTTTNQAPVTGDVLITSGTYNSPGVNSATTVTMNSVSSVNTYSNIYIGSNGIFNYGVAESTNYRLKFSGNIFIGINAIFTIGTELNPIPSTSTATLEMTCGSVGQFSIQSYGTFITQGTTRNVRSKLSADVSVGATSSATSDVTGWKTGDVIAVPSTSRTTSQFETISLSSDSTGTNLSHNAYVNAHGGNSTTLVQADICLLTRNIKIFNTNAATRGYITFQNNSTSITRYTEFYNWGYSISGAIVNYGIGFAHATLGTAIFEYNSYYATTRLSYSAFYLLFTSASITGNVFYALSIYASTGVSPIFGYFLDDNLFIANGGFAAVSGSVRNRNVVASSANHGLASSGFINGDSYDNNIYSNSSGIYFQGTSGVLGFRTFNLRCWRNGSGMLIYGTAGNSATRDTFYMFENCYTFGNGNHLAFQTTYTKIVFNNSYFWGGDATARTNFGLTTSNNGSINNIEAIYFNQCKFGIDYLGVDNFFTTACLQGAGGGSVIMNGCKFAGTENSIFTTYLVPFVYQNIGMVSINHNEVEGQYKIFSRTFNALSDSIYTTTGNASLRITPAFAGAKSTTPNVRVPVKKGTTCTISVKVRESVNVVDTQYNGANPRLMWVYNPIAGNLTETACASYPDNGNLITSPENLLSGWTGLSVTISTPGISPVGYNSAYKVAVAPLAPLSFLTTGIITTSYPAFTGTRNVSFYVKSAGLNLARVLIGSSSSLSNQIYVTANLETGLIIDANSTCSIENVGNGWFRLNVDVISVSATNNRFGVTFNDTIKTTGNSIDGVYVWGSQVTEGAGVKPYIAYGTWQTLSYTTPVMPYDSVLDFYVDCDGTAGFINVDSWKSTGADSKNNGYWLQNGPHIESDWTKPGGTYTFVS